MQTSILSCLIVKGKRVIRWQLEGNSRLRHVFMSPWETWEDLSMLLDCGKEDENESECGRKSEREMSWEYRKKRHVMWRGGAWGIEGSVRRSHFREQEGKCTVRHN